MANASEQPVANAGNGFVSEDARRLAELQRAARERQKQALNLQRENILSQRTSNPARRAALEAALAQIEAQIAVAIGAKASAACDCASRIGMHRASALATLLLAVKQQRVGLIALASATTRAIFTCAGRVTAHTIASATSSAVSGVIPL